MRPLLLCLLLVGCSTTKPTQVQTPLRVLDATSMEWLGGRPESGRGIDYRFQLLALAKLELAFDSVWIGRGAYQLHYRFSNANIKQSWSKGDTISLTAKQYMPPGYTPPKDAIESPIKYQGEALLRYFLNGVAGFVEVPQFRKLPSVAYP